MYVPYGHRPDKPPLINGLTMVFQNLIISWIFFIAVDISEY